MRLARIGTFEIYSQAAWKQPQFGVKVPEGVAPEKILYYIKAMWLTFRAYGNYENRGKARTRYMQEALGGAENYRKAYQEKLQEVLASGEQLDLSREEVMAAAGIKEKQSKTGDGSSASGEQCAGAETAGTLYGYLASDWRTAAPGDAGSPGRTDADDCTAQSFAWHRMKLRTSLI